MDKIKVLFVCIHNSARSQMAEAYVNYLAGDKFEAESAGLEPGVLNQNVIKVLKEDGIDITDKKTKNVFEFFKQGKLFHYVITVCDETAAERCPIFSGVTKRIHWSFPDPSKLEGGYDDIIIGTRIIRDQIKHRIQEWINDSKFIIEANKE